MKEEADRLRRQATACRRIAAGHHNECVIRQYGELARQYDEMAAAVEEAVRQKDAGQLH